MSYGCVTCGEEHEGLPDLSFARPDYVDRIAESERDSRIKIDTDLCSIDGENFFIRGVIYIPIRGETVSFGIGAWVSQKEENFWAYVENYDSDEIGPFFGWLSNEFEFGGVPTLNLKTVAHFQGNGLRPLIKIEPSDHPLSMAQDKGIALEEAWSFMHARHTARSA